MAGGSSYSFRRTAKFSFLILFQERDAAAPVLKVASKKPLVQYLHVAFSIREAY
jgi:hypothetical protein